MLTEKPEEFAAWFNEKCPGAYRPITAVDVQEMTACGLIRRHGYYSRSEDLNTVLGILRYEQLRDQRQVKPPADKGQAISVPRPRLCKGCDTPLAIQSTNKLGGRPREYCDPCQLSRSRDRNRRWRRNRRRETETANRNSME